MSWFTNLFRRSNIIPVRHRDSLVVANTPRSAISEHFRMIRTAVEAADGEVKILSVISPSTGDGKSVVAANLAVAFAQQGKETLYIDANWRRPIGHNIFQLPDNKQGLTNVVRDEIDFYELLHAVDGVPILSVLTAGESPIYPSELLSSKRMKDFLAEVRERYDMVIVDTPALTNFADGQVMAEQSDGSVFVVKNYKTDKKPLLKAKQIIEQNKINIVGTVFNAVE